MGLLGKVERLFEQTKERSIQDCIGMVEDLCKENGVDPSKLRNDAEGIVRWVFPAGGIEVFLCLIQYDKGATLKLIAPILYLPKEKLLPFYRRCLELNMELMHCSLGALDDKICLVSERPAYGLDKEELEGTLSYIATAADDLDDRLANEFGATRLSDRPQ